MGVTELKALWWHTVDTAAEAVEAGRKARTLAPSSVHSSCSGSGTSEIWLARVEWP
jgi:hypothetical protein